MSVRRCFRFSKVLAVLFTVYVSERYLDNRPVFRQTKTVRLFFSSLADILASRGSRRRRHDAPRRAKSLLLSVVKQKRTSKHLSVLFGGETGICSCLLQSNPCEIFLCFAKAFGQPLKTTHRVVFLTLSFKSLLLIIEKQNGQASLLVRFVWRRNRDLNPGYAPHVLLP